MDWFSIPQIHVRQEGVSEEMLKINQELAIQSIPAYVESASLFLVLAPEMQHTELEVICNYTSWLSRGWCRSWSCTTFFVVELPWHDPVQASVDLQALITFIVFTMFHHAPKFVACRASE